MTCHLWDIWPCWTFSLHCSQRLILYLNNLFYFCEHFQTHRFLVKHWRKCDETQTTNVSNGESDSTEATSHQKNASSPLTPHTFSLSLSSRLKTGTWSSSRPPIHSSRVDCEDEEMKIFDHMMRHKQKYNDKHRDKQCKYKDHDNDITW